MSNPSALGALIYHAESAFGEDATTFTTFRLPIRDPVDLSGLVHNKMASERTEQYRQGGSAYVLGTMGGTIRTRMFLTGHGSTTSGATAATAYETLLGLVFGNVTVSAASGTTFTGGTATIPTTTASGTFATGSIGFAGSINDARGGGQAFVVSDHSGTSLTVGTALGGAPSNADVCYSAVNIYPSETPTSASVSSVRFAALTGNLCYELHGCVPTAVSITGLNSSELPTIDITWSVAWWRYTTSVTFPSTVATDATNPSAVAGGSLFVQDVGTSTRATRTYRNFTIDYTIGMELLRGPGGVNQYQDIVGARRTVDSIRVSWVEDADTATTTPVLPGYGTGTTRKHALYTSATAAGSRIAIYMPNICITNVATQMIDQNLNRLRIEGAAHTGGTTSNDLTLSALRMAFA